jgi:hypothetical protein
VLGGLAKSIKVGLSRMSDLRRCLQGLTSSPYGKYGSQVQTLRRLGSHLILNTPSLQVTFCGD